MATTCITLRKMRKSFGKDSTEDAKMLKFTLIIFSASYILRITEDILLSANESKAKHFSAEWLAGLRLASWILWDLIPILCLYVIHFDNFNSYSNDEILYCEYSEDARSSSTSYADFLFREIGDKDEESLFKKTLPGASSSQFNSQLELESSDDSDND